MAVASLGGPLALAALYAPSIASGASSSAGLAMVAAAVVFGFPLAIWFGYARHVSSAGGLYSFTEAAAGRQVALAQAGLWALSYLLYMVYTTAQIVYDTLPAVLPGEVRYQTPLEVVIPVVLAGVMIAGRRVALVVLGLLAAGQLALAAALSGVTLANVTTPAGSFGASAPAGSLAIASGQTALLYICGSLPFFLGGELGADLRHAFRVTRRGLLGAYVATVVVIIAAVAPLAADPALAQGAIPGMAVAERFVGHGFAVTVGIGVAVSVAGVILVEYLALRATTAVTAWPLRRVIIGIGVIMVATGPVLLINPQRIYDTLITPSLFALWLSQLVTFAVYPRFVARRGGRVLPALVLAAGASALAIYGLWTTIQTSSIGSSERRQEASCLTARGARTPGTMGAWPGFTLVRLSASNPRSRLATYLYRQSSGERELARAGRARQEKNTMRNSMVKRMPVPARLAAGVSGAVGAALLVAACSSGGSSNGAAASSSPAGASAASGSGATVITTASSSGSTFLTDGSGRAMYLWVKDTGSTSACTGACAAPGRR